MVSVSRKKRTVADHSLPSLIGDVSGLWVSLWFQDFPLESFYFFLKCILTLLLKLFFFFSFLNFTLRMVFHLTGWAHLVFPHVKPGFCMTPAIWIASGKGMSLVWLYPLIHLIDAITMHSSPSVIRIYIIFPETTIVTTTACFQLSCDISTIYSKCYHSLFCKALQIELDKRTYEQK